MSKDLSPAQHAAAIDAARQRLIAFVLGCTGEQWRSSPVDGDPRPVSVITDHVAHAYEYLAGWIGEIVAGGSPAVSSALVDELNAEHAADAGSVTTAQVAGHLKSSGDALIGLVQGLEPAQLDLAGGRVRRLAEIAARHADNHRTEIEAALG
jgi:hypothetical protein